MKQVSIANSSLAKGVDLFSVPLSMLGFGLAWACIRLCMLSIAVISCVLLFYCS